MIAVFVALAGIYFGTIKSIAYYKERQVINMSIANSPIELNRLITNKVLSSEHEFAITLKKEIDFAARWFKEKVREDMEVH